MEAPGRFDDHASNGGIFADN
ncbi:hypothetical protein BVI434_1710008 [Burkholderia vietnamiensis]|nr:hypothetical protein BVI434_1710008 [Burkholderia vietnamiensis]